jgi:hypothetical protein
VTRQKFKSVREFLNNASNGLTSHVRLSTILVSSMTAYPEFHALRTIPGTRVDWTVLYSVSAIQSWTEKQIQAARKPDMVSKKETVLMYLNKLIQLRPDVSQGPRGLQPPEQWDCWFESRSRHGCTPAYLCVFLFCISDTFWLVDFQPNESLYISLKMDCFRIKFQSEQAAPMWILFSWV